MGTKDTSYSDSTKKHLEKIGNSFHDRRIMLKKDILEVAADSHITPALLRKIEAGEYRHLTIKVGMVICTALDLDPREVLSMKL